MARNAFKPVTGIKPPSSPAHKIASQFQAVHPARPEIEGYQAQRDMYEVDRAQNFMAQNPYGITHGQP